MSAPILLDFHDQPSATKALGKVAQYMQRAGQPVVSTSFDAKVKRSSNVSYREAMLTLASGQTVTLRVTQTGDIFQVLLNGSVKPIKNATDQIKAVGEIAKLAESNQAAFQKKQARVKVELPKGLKTAAPRMEVALQARVAELDTQIAERQTQVDELKEELGEAPVLDAATPSDVIAWHDGNSYARDQFDLVPTDEHGEMPPGLVLKAGAVPVTSVLDDVAAPVALPFADMTWCGFKVANQEFVDQTSAEVLPSANAISGPVYISIERANGAPADIPGTVVAVKFSASKVLYSIAVPILHEQGGGTQLYAVLHDIDSVAVNPRGPAGVLDSVVDFSADVALLASRREAPILDGTTDGEPDLAAAVTLAESVLSGTVLDSAGTTAAVATLQIALQTVETNHVINMSEGNLEQAELEQSNAESFRAALALLDAAEPPAPPVLPIPDAPEPSKAGEPAIAAAAAFQYPDDAPVPPMPDPRPNPDPAMFGA